ncbi:MAG: M56 family metallopeptidase [Bacteroidales bacterium]|nr:M56 family metallopeptidase [Bacteroidales bacterium]HOI31262.1 M56 family metallopeptidase [Bacteroidales bacterium]
MEILLSWNLRAAVYLLIFTIAYLLILRRNTRVVFNRFYILLSSLLAMILPVIPLNIYDLSIDKLWPNVLLPEVLISPMAESEKIVVEQSTFNLNLYNVFALICLGFLLRYVFRLLWIVFLIIRLKAEPNHGMKIVRLESDKIPFSFFNWLFVSEHLLNDLRFDPVLEHEKAHADRFHSLDILYFELLQAVFWYHPAWYFMRNELKTMHEFEADQLAIRKVNRSVYQRTLLELTTYGGMFWLTNPFNVSLIKKRMLMMNQIKGNKPALKWLKIALLLPFFVAAVFIQSCNFATDSVEEVKLKEDQTPAFKQEQAPGEEVFTVVDVMPEFPGGATAMMNFIANNITYPEQARRDTIHGRVYVNFVVETDGSVSNVKILRGIGGGCDEEAKRVVELLPKFTPGYQRGQAVRVSFNLPVKFVLN